MRRTLALTLITLAAAGPLAGLIGVSPALAAGAPTGTGTTGTGTGTGTTGTGTAGTATTPTTTPVVTTPGFSLGNSGGVGSSAPTVSTPAASSNTSSSGGGLSTGDGILIGAICIALMVGIWGFVVRDARHRTRRDPELSDDPFAGRRKGSKAPPKSRKLTPAERRRRRRGRATRGR